jgi:hypothetical protein
LKSYCCICVINSTRIANYTSSQQQDLDAMKNGIKKLCFWVWKNLIQSKGLGLIIYSQLQTQTKTASNPSDKIGRCKNCTQSAKEKTCIIIAFIQVHYPYHCQMLMNKPNITSHRAGMAESFVSVGLLQLKQLSCYLALLISKQPAPMPNLLE